jgi:excinuclease UvrABC nuclease subunit
VLAHRLTFSPQQDEGFFEQVPAAAAVFALRGDGEPYVSKTASLRRRLQRLLGPPAEQSKRLNLRDRVREVEFTLTGSDFESQFLLYRVLRETFPKTYTARLRLRPAPVIKLHLENEYPRASVTTRLGKLQTIWGRAPSPVQASEARLSFPAAAGQSLSSPEPNRTSTDQIGANADRGRGARATLDPTSLYYGPFPSRAAAEKFASDALDFFKMRRCVDDLHPDPSFPGCVYSEMKMCLAPCFKGCSDAEYQAEVSRVQDFLDSAGESLSRELQQEREHASAELAFEEAAAIHAKLEKLKPVMAQVPEIVRRIDRLDALIVQPSAEKGAVALFRFAGAALGGPVIFHIEMQAESRSMESRVEEMLANFPSARKTSAVEHIEHLAILKRWYYRTTRLGEIFFADENGWPLRRMVRGIGRVSKGEKPQEGPTFSATPAAKSPS